MTSCAIDIQCAYHYPWGHVEGQCRAFRSPNPVLWIDVMRRVEPPSKHNRYRINIQGKTRTDQYVQTCLQGSLPAHGPMDQWTNGPIGPWTNRPMDTSTNITMGKTVEKQQGCLEKISLKDSLITRGTSNRKCFPDKPKAFSLFVRLYVSSTKEEAAEGLPEENPAGGFNSP